MIPLILSILVPPGQVFSSPLDPTPFFVMQPDGSQLKIRAVGDEWYSYLQTIDGYTILKHSDGGYYYAVRDPSGHIKPGVFLARQKENRTFWEQAYLAKIGRSAQPDLEIILEHISNNPYSLKNFVNERSLINNLNLKMGGKKAINLCVLLVEFDEVNHLFPKNNFDSFFNGDTPTTVKTYYQDASYGQVEIQADIFNWYRDNTPLQSRDFDKPVEQMLNNAILGLDGEIDFSKYDNDKDGKLDAIIMIYAGEFQQNNNETRYNFGAYAGSLGSTYKLIADGVAIDRMCCSSELKANGDQQAVGVAIHELGHLIFAMPDIYDTAGNTSGVGHFCTMGALWLDGGWTPPMLGAFSKECAGFAEPILIPELTNNKYSIQTAYDHNDAIFRINMPDNPTEYFLIENRQKIQNDKYLPGDGMLIWHIDIKMSGNNSEQNDHQKVTLEQADGYNDLLRGINNGDSGDPFPGNRLKRTFDNDSQPNSNDWFGNITNIAIDNISDSDSGMTADIYVPETTTLDTTQYFDLVYNDFEQGLGKFEDKPQITLYTEGTYAFQGNNAILTGGNPSWAGVVQGPWTTIDPMFQQVKIEYYFITTGFSGTDRIRFWIWDGHNGNGWGNTPLNFGEAFENEKFYRVTAVIPKGKNFSFNPNANFAVMPEAGNGAKLYVDLTSLSAAFTSDATDFTLDIVEVQKDITSRENLAVEGADLVVFPNPSSGTAQIEIVLEETAVVSLMVYNSLGQCIETIVNGQVCQGGRTSIQWTSCEKLIPGLYFICAVLDRQVAMQKVFTKL